MRSFTPFCTLLLLLGLTLLSQRASADEPTAAYIFPAGGQRGSEVSFKVGGHFFHGEAAFEMLGVGVRAQPTVKECEQTLWFEGPMLQAPDSSRKEDYPRDHAGRVVIAADAPLGVRPWRIATSQGATGHLKFVIGDLPEIVEHEIDGEPVPVAVTLPVTINGRIFPREDVDAWTVKAAAGEVITAVVNAARLGSPLDARLEVRDATGRVLGEATDGFGVDPKLRFRAPADGTYEIRIHDVSFAGLQHFVYRLTLTRGLYVDAVYPLGGQQTAEVAFELLGAAVPEAPLTIKLPADQGNVMRQPLDVAGRQSNPVQIAIGRHPEHFEAEPNNRPDAAQLINLPATLNGRIDKPGDMDCWAFAAKKGDTLQVEVSASRLGSPLDSVLEVIDTEGKVLARSDDMAGGQTDSKLLFKPNADGTFYVRVAGRFASRGGVRFAYRLSIEPGVPAEPDFRITLADSVVTVFRDLPETDQPANSSASPKPKRLKQPVLKVEVQRLGGFQEAIQLVVEGLPEGVTLAGDKIAAKRPNTQLRFTAAQATKIGTARLKIRGVAKVGDKEVSRPAVVADRELAKYLDHVLLAVAMPAPFSYEKEYSAAFAARGSIYSKRFKLHRGGYTGPLTVRLADRQGRHLQGVHGPTLTIPPGANEFEYPIRLPPWMKLGRTSRSVVMIEGVVEDHDGSRHRVSYSAGGQNDQIIGIVSPGQLTVATERPALRMQPGEDVSVVVTVQRAPSIARVPVRVELQTPPHLQFIAAEPITLAPDEDEGRLELRFAPSASRANMPVVVRAETIGLERAHVAETPLELIEPLR